MSILKESLETNFNLRSFQHNQIKLMKSTFDDVKASLCFLSTADTILSAFHFPADKENHEHPNRLREVKGSCIVFCSVRYCLLTPELLSKASH